MRIEVREIIKNQAISDDEQYENCLYCGEVGAIPKHTTFEGNEIPLHKKCRKVLSVRRRSE